jgi:hypothetical protein
MFYPEKEEGETALGLDWEANMIPDAIGGGDSSKPSDGLHSHFPHYGYKDQVRAQHLLL